MNNVCFWNSGIIFNLPEFTSSIVLFATSLQLIHHCAFTIGSITSPDFEHIWRTILFGCLPLINFISVNLFIIATLQSYLFIPLNSPPFSFNVPSSLNILITSKLCRLPQRKSLGSCAGVILTAPVPKDISTKISSAIIFIFLSGKKGCINSLPIKSLYLSSFGWTATAVSPSIVSIRVVDTIISFEGSSLNL